MRVKKCDWCEEGLCTYYRSVEEQYAQEEDGFPVDNCEGTEEEQRDCGFLTDDE